MNHQVTSLTAAFKNVDAFGIANAADFLPASMGGQRFALIALHVLKTIVPNIYKNNPAKLAEWATASHVEKHTPVPRPPKPAATPAKN